MGAVPFAYVRISAYPIRRMQNYKDFCRVQSESHFVYKLQQKCKELCGLTLRSHWKKGYYQTQIYEESVFVGNPFEGPDWTEEPAPAPFLLRMSCGDLAPDALSVRLGFLTKRNIVDLFSNHLFHKGFNDISTYNYVAV